MTPPPLVVKTPRLKLIAATYELVDAQLHDPRRYETLVGARLPDGWPPELTEDVWEFTLERLLDPAVAGWWLWYVVLDADRTAIGTAGFKGPPAEDGSVEVGYSVMPAWRRAGYAAEAVAGLIGWAAGTGRVRRVFAHTYPHLAPSIGVLTKLGFELEGPGAEEGTARYALAVTAR